MPSNKNKPALGGQALIEGVMIKSPNYVTMAARGKNGIQFNSYECRAKKAGKIPFVRGIVNLIDMLVFGTKALIWSSQVAVDDGESDNSKLSKSEIAITLFLSFAFAIGIFVILPYFLTTLFGFKEGTKPVMFNLIDGLIRISFFIIYLLLISRMKDVRRLFEYHGAEHMSIHCYEAEKELTVQNIKGFSPIHPRCGTSFIMIVFCLSILVFSFVPSIVQLIVPNLFQLGIVKQKAILFLSRLIFIPVIAGISYEILRMNKMHSNNAIMRLINYPGILIQKITTRKPDDSEIEVAIASVNKAIEKESDFKQA